MIRAAIGEFGAVCLGCASVIGLIVCVLVLRVFVVRLQQQQLLYAFSTLTDDAVLVHEFLDLINELRVLHALSMCVCCFQYISMVGEKKSEDKNHKFSITIKKAAQEEKKNSSLSYL